MRPNSIRAAADKSADAYRTISEVAEELKLPQHVLRFWETRFPQIKPMKRGGNRRFYRPEDVELLRAIRAMLYGDGYTIKGVQRILKQQGPKAVAGLAQARPPRPAREGRGDGLAHGGDDASGPDTRAVLSLPLPMRDTRDEADEVEPDQDPPSDPTPPGYASFHLSERLQAVLYDIAECERLLAAARA